VNEHFVKPGLLAPEHARVLRRTAADRGDADYDASATFGPEDSRADVADADLFLQAVEKLLGG
jgi:uncharacterized protein (UPF0332 family)